jgi:hypothetical protein
MNWILRLWNAIKSEIQYRKKVKEMKEIDPYIYK